MKLLKPLLVLTFLLVLLSNFFGCGPDVKLEPGENLKKLPQTTEKVERHDDQLKDRSNAKESLKEIIARVPPNVSSQPKIQILTALGSTNPSALILGQIDSKELVVEADALDLKSLASQFSAIKKSDPETHYLKFSENRNTTQSSISMDRDLFIYAQRFVLNEDETIQTNGKNLTIVAEEVEIYGKIKTTPTSLQAKKEGLNGGELKIVAKTLKTSPSTLVDLSPSSPALLVEERDWSSLNAESKILAFQSFQKTQDQAYFSEGFASVDPFRPIPHTTLNLKRFLNLRPIRYTLGDSLNYSLDAIIDAVIAALKSDSSGWFPPQLAPLQKMLKNGEADDALRRYVLDFLISSCMASSSLFMCTDNIMIKIKATRIGALVPRSTARIPLSFGVPPFMSEISDSHYEIQPGALSLLIGQANSFGLPYIQGSETENNGRSSAKIRVQNGDQLSLQTELRFEAEISWGPTDNFSPVAKGLQTANINPSDTRNTRSQTGSVSYFEELNYSLKPLSTFEEVKMKAMVSKPEIAAEEIQPKTVLIERGTGYEGDWKNIYETMRGWNLPGFDPEREPFKTFKILSENAERK